MEQAEVTVGGRDGEKCHLHPAFGPGKGGDDNWWRGSSGTWYDSSFCLQE